MIWALANWRKVALGALVLALLASYAATYSAGYRSATTACEARLSAAELEAARKAADAVRQQRARADALQIANRTLQGIADDILAQSRGACPLDPDTRGRLLQIRP